MKGNDLPAPEVYLTPALSATSKPFHRYYVRRRPCPSDERILRKARRRGFPRVLIAFPDWIDRWVMKITTRELLTGYNRIVFSKDMVSTLCCLSAYKPSILIVDQEMFAKDGLKKVLKAQPAVKILVVGEFPWYDLARKYLESGAHGYVTYHWGMDFDRIFRKIRKGEKFGLNSY